MDHTRQEPSVDFPEEEVIDRLDGTKHPTTDPARLARAAKVLSRERNRAIGWVLSIICDGCNKDFAKAGRRAFDMAYDYVEFMQSEEAPSTVRELASIAGVSVASAHEHLTRTRAKKAEMPMDSPGQSSFDPNDSPRVNSHTL